MELSNLYRLFTRHDSGATIREGSFTEVAELQKSIPEFEPLDENEFLSRCDGKSRMIFIGMIGRTNVGYIIGYDRDGDGTFYCWMAGVLPEYRRHGVMSDLFERFERWCRDNGYRGLHVRTRNHRREMLSFLVKQGFYFADIEKRERLEEHRLSLFKPIL